MRLHFPRNRQTQEFSGNVRGPVHIAPQHIQPFKNNGVAAQFPHNVRIGAHDAERIVDLVRHAGRQFSYNGQPFGLDQLLFHEPAFRNIPGDAA